VDNGVKPGGGVRRVPALVVVAGVDEAGHGVDREVVKQYRMANE
jgi:hypothetical protein